MADIVEIEEEEVAKVRMKRVGIFLSVFDVHTNRAPIDGKVTYLQHHPGAFLDARHVEATTRNEAMTWAFQGEPRHAGGAADHRRDRAAHRAVVEDGRLACEKGSASG